MKPFAAAALTIAYSPDTLIAERGRRFGGLAERAVEGRGVLRRVGEDRRVRQLFADRTDAAVHHVARTDGVRACLDMADGSSRDQLQGLVVRDLTVAHDSAVAVRGVLAEADVSEQRQTAVFERVQSALDDAVVVVGAGPFLVLLPGDAEEDHRTDPEPCELLSFGGHRFDGVSRESRQIRVP